MKADREKEERRETEQNGDKQGKRTGKE